MSTAVRQHLIVMLISELLPPSLHSFSWSFVSSLPLTPLSLRHSPSPRHSCFPPLSPAVISICPLSGSLPSPSLLSLPSSSSFLQFISSLLLSLHHPPVLCHSLPHFCSLVFCDESLPPWFTLFSLLYSPLPSSHLLTDKRSSKASRKYCVSSSGQTVCVCVCVNICVSVQVHVCISQTSWLYC